VPLTGDIGKILAEPITLGVIFGLVLGKPFGVTLASFLAVRSGIASRPENVSWRHIHGAGWLAGIGFTMSLFMTGLAFTDEAAMTAAKLGILISSVLAGVIGSAILWRKPASALSNLK
jgi:NhaA family Na+:H+ antiporter